MLLLDNTTEYPICTEVYTDPRVLPCVHTYCLKCIEKYSEDKQPGDELASPLCRKEFTLPGNGVADLPKNFFVNNLLQMKELSSVENKTSPCEACSGGEESESEVQNVAAGAHLPLLSPEPVSEEPIMSVTDDQCDAGPTVTFPAARHHRPLAGTKLYYLVTEARVC